MLKKRRLAYIPVGLSPGQTFASIFMAFYKRNWLENCPLQMALIFFGRYVDDCFAIFRYPNYSVEFFSYLN